VSGSVTEKHGDDEENLMPTSDDCKVLMAVTDAVDNDLCRDFSGSWFRDVRVWLTLFLHLPLISANLTVVAPCGLGSIVE